MPVYRSFSWLYVVLFLQQNQKGELYGQICAGITVVILFVIIFFQLRKQKSRQGELQHFAALGGYSINGDVPSLIQQIHGQSYELFQEGGINAVSNTLNIHYHPYDINFFDFAKTSLIGKSSFAGIKFLSGVLLQTEMEVEISFSIKPKKGSDRFMQGLGLRGITFDHPAFSKKYIVEGYDEDNIQAALNPAVLDFISAQPERMVIEGRPNQLLIYYENQQVDPEKLKDFLKMAVHIFELTDLPKEKEEN